MPAISPEDLQFQNESLAQVSRTFAMTIPELPEDLRIAVGNAYLWCRVADTIEDAAGVSLINKARALIDFPEMFSRTKGYEPQTIATRLSALLKGHCTLAELDLLQNIPRVFKIFDSLPESQQKAIQTCVYGMSTGMDVFQEELTRGGIKTIIDLDDYCYLVAGIVGEMLTDLFSEHSEKIAAHREELMPLSVSFGQALQMTNILKDVWSDKDREMCWLPSEVFEKHGFNLKKLHLRQPDAGFEAAMLELLDIAQGYLAESLDYVYLLPPEETGIRRFCLYALGMAVLTLQKIRQNPRFTNADDVKISRETVYEVVQKVNEICGNNDKLRAAFAAMNLG